jgi:hypothetical protein
LERHDAGHRAALQRTQGGLQAQQLIAHHHDDAAMLDFAVLPALAEAGPRFRLETQVRSVARPGVPAIPPPVDRGQRGVDLRRRGIDALAVHDHEAVAGGALTSAKVRSPRPGATEQDDSENASSRHEVGGFE